MTIVRTDRYTVRIDGYSVRATHDQERRLRAMTAEDLARFLRIMGKEEK